MTEFCGKSSIFADHAKKDNYKLDHIYASYMLLTAIIPDCPNYFTIAEAYAKAFKDKTITEKIYKALRRGQELPVSAFRTLQKNKKEEPAREIIQILAWE